MAVNAHHGNTPAAWTGATIAFIGFCVSAVFTVMAEPIGFIAGIVIVLAGPVVGLAMRSAGLGAAPQPQYQPPAKAEQH